MGIWPMHSILMYTAGLWWFDVENKRFGGETTRQQIFGKLGLFHIYLLDFWIKTQNPRYFQHEQGDEGPFDSQLCCSF